MKALRLLALAATSLLALGNRCQPADEAPCPAPAIAGTSPQFYPCIVDQRSSEPQLFVVNSQEEFANTFPCSSYRPRPSAFRDSTLLVGWKGQTPCSHVKSQQVHYACASNTYTYQVMLEEGLCAAFRPVTSQLLVPKLPTGAKVVIEMQ